MKQPSEFRIYQVWRGYLSRQLAFFPLVSYRTTSIILSPANTWLTRDTLLLTPRAI
jgi:hypothetical protein